MTCDMWTTTPSSFGPTHILLLKFDSTPPAERQSLSNLRLRNHLAKILEALNQHPEYDDMRWSTHMTMSFPMGSDERCRGLAISCIQCNSKASELCTMTQLRYLPKLFEDATSSNKYRQCQHRNFFEEFSNDPRTSANRDSPWRRTKWTNS